MEKYVMELSTELIGTVTIAQDEAGICDVHLGAAEELPGEWLRRKTPLLQKAGEQLHEYLRGERRDFTLPLSYGGTPFQREVWDALQKIPYGETRTYGELAASIGRPKACRAVGAANHVNRLVILIPCHRVVGANGALVGYGGGLENKRKLLELEQKIAGEK